VDKFDYFLQLQAFDFPPNLVDLALELPGYSVPHETVLCLLRYTINVKRLSKTEVLYRLAKFAALLDVRRNKYIDEQAVEDVFIQIFEKLQLD
jgi:hypothetical protein